MRLKKIGVLFLILVNLSSFKSIDRKTDLNIYEGHFFRICRIIDNDTSMGSYFLKKGIYNDSILSLLKSKSKLYIEASKDSGALFNYYFCCNSKIVINFLKRTIPLPVNCRGSIFNKEDDNFTYAGVSTVFNFSEIEEQYYTKIKLVYITNPIIIHGKKSNEWNRYFSGIYNTSDVGNDSIYSVSKIYKYPFSRVRPAKFINIDSFLLPEIVYFDFPVTIRAKADSNQTRFIRWYELYNKR